MVQVVRKLHTLTVVVRKKYALSDWKAYYTMGFIVQ